jgi:hypothetical protein
MVPAATSYHGILEFLKFPLPQTSACLNMISRWLSAEGLSVGDRSGTYQGLRHGRLCHKFSCSQYVANSGTSRKHAEKTSIVPFSGHPSCPLQPPKCPQALLEACLVSAAKKRNTSGAHCPEGVPFMLYLKAYTASSYAPANWLL